MAIVTSETINGNVRTGMMEGVAVKDLETLRKIVERGEELNRLYGEGNWRVRKVTSSGGRVFLAVTTELKHLGVRGGDRVIVATTTLNGRPVVVIERL
ncbi:hypothetical protein [Thermococcus sp.]|uniref:hypothetical protein n=1 Tax=Thermococcus sp. TaxID=35749 RepID=UPI002610CAE5|nr:hypothetical protein [Thermococcus sp.]